MLTGMAGILDHNGRPYRDTFSHNGNPDRWDKDLLSGEMGRLAVPQVLTFSSLMGSAWRAYWHGRHDEAYKDSRPDALAMRRDPHLMGLLQERILAVSSLRWHLEGHDEKNPAEVALKDQIEGAIRKTPNLRKLIKAELQAIWYGRAGCQIRPVWQDIKGQPTVTVGEWLPVNGDKIGHRWDGTPYVLVSSSWADRLPSAETFPTTLGRGLLLQGRWRERFIIHSHEVEDGDFFEPESAGGAYGLGLRHRLYWYWWMKQEFKEWTATYMERVGLGITLWMYDASNPEGKTRAEEAAREAGRRTNLLVPTWPDGRGGKPVGGVERIETPVAGIEALRTMEDKIDEVMERFIVGQSMSGGSDSEGSLGGTGRANFAANTKLAITEDDSNNLGETLTGNARNPGLVWLIQSKTRPDMAEVPLRWVFDVESTESKEKLDAAKTCFDMGIPLRSDEVRGAAGFSKPAEGDETVKNPDEQAQGGPPMQEQREDPALAKQMMEQELAIDGQRHAAELAQKQAAHEQTLRHEEEKHKHAMTREEQKTAFAAQQAARKAAQQAQEAQRRAVLRQQQAQQRAQQQAMQPAAQQPYGQAGQTRQMGPAGYSRDWDGDGFLARLASLSPDDHDGMAEVVDGLLALPAETLEAVQYIREGEADQYEATFDESAVKRDAAGKFASSGGSPGALKKLFGSVKGLKERAKVIGKAWWENRPPDTRRRLKRLAGWAAAAEHKAMIAFHKGKEMAAEIARQRGYSEETAERAAKVVAVVDQALAWTTTFPAVSFATGNPALGKAASFVPMGSLAYLAWSTARNPLAVIRAARKVFKKKVHPPHDPSPDDSPRERPAARLGLTELPQLHAREEGSLPGYEDTEALMAGLHRAENARGADGADWYMALVLAGLDACDNDLAAAVEDADEAFAESDLPDCYDDEEPAQ